MNLYWPQADTTHSKPDTIGTKTEAEAYQTEHRVHLSLKPLNQRMEIVSLRLKSVPTRLHLRSDRMQLSNPRLKPVLGRMERVRRCGKFVSVGKGGIAVRQIRMQPLQTSLNQGSERMQQGHPSLIHAPDRLKLIWLRINLVVTEPSQCHS